MATISIAKDKRNKKEYSIQEILKIRENSPHEFEEIKPNLVCYECGKPQMVPRLGEITEHHYAKAPNQIHQFDCYYFGDEYTQREVDKIVSSIERNKPSQDQLMRAFNQIQCYLNRDESELDTTTLYDFGNSKKYNKSESNSADDKNHISNYKYIPRKKLTKEILEEDIGVWKIYYGHVGIKHVNSTGHYQNFGVYANLNKEIMPYRISIGIVKKIFQYFDTESQNIFKEISKQKKMVSLMVLGKISQHKKYNNIVVYDTRLLKISP